MEPMSWKSRGSSTRFVGRGRVGWCGMIAGVILISGPWVSVVTHAQTSTERSTAESGLPIVSVAIAGRIFRLELAQGRRAQQRGLGGRTQIDPYGGMLFAYGTARERAMVMRDCPVPIDVAFLNAQGRVVGLHAMQPEPPRGDRESESHYEARLPVYPSGEAAQFAVELAGGRLARLGVRIGDPLVADWTALASEVR